MRGPKTTLTLKRYAESLGPTGASVRTWSNVALVTGVLKSLSANERFQAMKKSVINTHAFYTDFRRDITITEKDIFVLGTRTFEITAAGPDSSNQERWQTYDLWEVQV